MMKSLNIIHESTITRGVASVDGRVWHDQSMEEESLRGFTKILYRKLELQYPKFYKMDDFCRLGFLAVERLMRQVDEDYQQDKVGIFLINRFSSIQTDLAFEATYGKGNGAVPSPSLFVYTLPNILIGEISIRHKLKGEHSFFVQCDFEADFIYLYVQTLFEMGILDAAVVGYCEVSPWTYGVKVGWVAARKNENETLNSNTFNEWIKR